MAREQGNGMHIYEVIPSRFAARQWNITIWILTISFPSSACFSCSCLLPTGTARRNTSAVGYNTCLYVTLQHKISATPAPPCLCPKTLGPAGWRPLCTWRLQRSPRAPVFPPEGHTGQTEVSRASESKFCKHEVWMSKVEATFTNAKLLDK